MKIDRGENRNRKKRKCEHCGDDILKDDPIILLFTEVIKFPAIYNGIAFHEACAKEHLEDLLKVV